MIIQKQKMIWNILLLIVYFCWPLIQNLMVHPLLYNVSKIIWGYLLISIHQVFYQTNKKKLQIMAHFFFVFSLGLDLCLYFQFDLISNGISSTILIFLNLFRAWIIVFVCIFIILEMKELSRNLKTWKLICIEIRSKGLIPPSFKSFFNIWGILINIVEKWKYSTKVIFTRQFPQAKKTVFQLTSLFIGTIFILPFLLVLFFPDLRGLPSKIGRVDYYFWLKTFVASTYGRFYFYSPLISKLIMTLIGGGLIFGLVQLSLKYTHDFKDYRKIVLLASHQITLENLDKYDQICTETNNMSLNRREENE